MPKIIKPNFIKIPARAWRAIRSFLDSSLKDSYSWNVGVDIDGTAVFTKHGKWELHTYKDSGIPVRELFTVDLVSLVKVRGTRVIVGLDLLTADLSDPNFHVHYLVPDGDVPFSYPIPLKDLVDKMLLYPTP